MNIYEERIKTIDKCSEILSDWLCESSTTFVEGIFERIQTGLDILQSLKGYLLAGSPIQQETKLEEFTRVLQAAKVLDEKTQEELINIAKGIYVND